MKTKRVTITVDWDVYEFAVYEAQRKRISLASEFRWIMRDGYARRLQLEAQYRVLAVEEAKHGR